MHIPDLSEATYSRHDRDGHEYRSVGWLGGEVTRREHTAPAVVATLRFLRDINQLPDHWRGLHACEICNGEHDKGEFFVEDHSVRYVMPNMVLHYIEAHQYGLPDVVEVAVQRSGAFTQAALADHIAVQEGNKTSGDVTAKTRGDADAELRRASHRISIAAGRKVGLIEGRLAGKRDALAGMLVRAGMVLTTAERSHIDACTDETILDGWMGRAFGAKTVGDVLSLCGRSVGAATSNSDMP